MYDTGLAFLIMKGHAADFGVRFNCCPINIIQVELLDVNKVFLGMKIVWKQGYYRYIIKLKQQYIIVEDHRRDFHWQQNTTQTLLRDEFKNNHQ